MEGKDQYKDKLNPTQWRVAFENGTEQPFTGEYHDNKAEGVYYSVAAEVPLFSSKDKFDSGTGWPSFTQPIKENAIQYIKDVSFGMVRVEVTCNGCDAHLGHVFPDGPEPSGLRYCINSESLTLQK